MPLRMSPPVPFTSAAPQAVKTAYSDLERRFVGRLAKEGRLHPRPLPDPAASTTPGICLYEFVRDKWTFHGKGVFLERRYFDADNEGFGSGAYGGSGGAVSGTSAVGSGGGAAGGIGTSGMPSMLPQADPAAVGSTAPGMAGPTSSTAFADGDIYADIGGTDASSASASHPLIVAPGLSSGGRGSGAHASAATKVSGGAMESAAVVPVQVAPPGSSGSGAAAAVVAPTAVGGAGAGGATPAGDPTAAIPGGMQQPQPAAVAMLTSVGSSNFGERSEHRDLELQLDMATSNAACVRRLQLERDALFAPDMATRQALIRALHESYPRDPAVLELMSGGGDGSGGADAPGAGGNAPGSDALPDAAQAHVTAAMPQMWQHGKRKIPFYMLPVTMMARSLKGYM